AAQPNEEPEAPAQAPVTLLDPDDPAAQEGELVGTRGIDPGWRDRRVAESVPNVWGQTGLRRITSASAGKAGYFDLGFQGSYFTTDDFILDGADSNTLLRGIGGFSFAPFRWMELSVATHAASNENSLSQPKVFASSGDFAPSFKLGYSFAPITFGVDVRGFLPVRQDAVGIDLGNVSVTTTGLLTLDLYDAYDLPLRVHANAGFVYQNARNAENPEALYFDSPEGHLLALPTAQWYYDQLVYGLGVEAPLPYVTPFVELFGQSAVNVASGFGVGGQDYSLGDAHLTVTPGLRFSVGRGLYVDLGLDLGLLGTGGWPQQEATKLVGGQPVNPLWAASFGLSYTFSPFVAETQVEVRERERATGRVAGCVTDASTGRPVEDAFVEFSSSTGPRIVVDGAGCFSSPALDLGPLTVQVRHPDYDTGEVMPELRPGKVVAADVRLTPAPRYGVWKGTVTNNDDEPQTGSLEVTDEFGQTRRVEIRDGLFRTQLPPGRYQSVVKVEGYLQQGTSLVVEPLGSTIQNFTVRKTPAKRVTVLKGSRIEISSRIPFEFNRARLLRDSAAILDDVVDVVLQNPQLKRIRVEGHTDPLGDASYNLQLSEERALAVVEYMVGRGVPKKQLEHVGYGANRPLGPNDTEEQRARNRRVEFVIVDE
ncbi:MAG: OmpA family protein, partial [Myxococcota bacterium]